MNKASADASYINPAFHGDERDGTGRPATLTAAEQGNNNLLARIIVPVKQNHPYKMSKGFHERRFNCISSGRGKIEIFVI